MKPAESVDDVLTAEQRAVMARVLAEEASRREHIVVYLSGAHAYGFPSPDSDLDLKAIHIAKTADLLGFDVPPPTSDRAEIIDGVEIDYTSNELAHALLGILSGNGNFLERVLGRMTATASPVLDEVRPLARRALSRRVHRHYRGFAQNQLRFLEQEPTAKKLLYVLRTATTGIHLLSAGELEPDLTRLMDRYDLADAAELVERKRAGERVGLDPALLEAWRPRIDALFARLDAALETSPLPEAPPNERELREWLMAVRRARFA
ncbi:MAG TPA: nucleotidyltransferase domain-containing protein [Polyangiaceae bacterium]|nr:nucleotidyltransferase domain-containing protein [Polyangiaceae bacterium]